MFGARYGMGGVQPDQRVYGQSPGTTLPPTVAENQTIPFSGLVLTREKLN